MQTQNNSRRVRRLVPHFGSLAGLVLAALMQSCSDNVGPEKKPSHDYTGFLRGGTYGVSFSNVDPTAVFGFAQTDLRFTHDPRLGDNQGVYYYAVMGSLDGPLPFTSAKVDGTSLVHNGGPGVIYEGYSLAGTVPGGTTTWELRTNDGVSVPPSTIDVPNRPAILSPGAYDHVSISRSLNINIDSHVDGGDAVVLIAYDSYRDELYGTNDDPIVGSTIRTRSFTVDDDGNLEIPEAELAGFSTGRIYNLIVYRWRYDTFARSDGEKAGILATVQYSVPIMLVD